MAEIETQNTKALSELLGPAAAQAGVLQSAIAEVAKEDAEARKAKAKELIRKAIGFSKQMDRAKRDFNAQVAKFDKELGKVLRQINAMADGKEPTEEEAVAS